MNQTVIDNRARIESACVSSFQSLVKCSEHITAHRKKTQEISRSPYIQEEKLRQINELEGITKANIVPLQKLILENIDTINNASTKIADEPMDSVDLSAIGTLSLMLGGSVSGEAIAGASFALQDYANRYRGQQKALKIIRIAFERIGDPAPSALKARAGDSLIFLLESRIEKLRHMVYLLDQIESNNVFNLARELEFFADDMGVKLPTTFKSMMNAANPDNYDNAYFARLADLMGLPSEM